MNHFRLPLASAAYLLVEHVRRVGLKGTALVKAQVMTVRTRLLKIAGRVRISVRRIGLGLASGQAVRLIAPRLGAHGAADVPASP